MSREIITLSNGKRVANFSSPHPFTFTDGSVIPAVSNEESERLKVNFIETEHPDESGDINLNFDLSTDVMFEMRYWVALYNVGYVDVVFCPLPMITAIKEATSGDAMAKAMADFKKRGGKIKKVAPGKAQGYHGKEDPGTDTHGMLSRGDTSRVGTRKKVTT